MSAYVVISGFGLLLEYPEDDVDGVAEASREIIDSGRAVTFQTSAGGVKILVNFHNVEVAVISREDPEEGVEEDGKRMRVTTSLADIERRLA
jgi:hypothetical protein